MNSGAYSSVCALRFASIAQHTLFVFGPWTGRVTAVKQKRRSVSQDSAPLLNLNTSKTRVILGYSPPGFMTNPTA